MIEYYYYYCDFNNGTHISGRKGLVKIFLYLKGSCWDLSDDIIKMKWNDDWIYKKNIWHEMSIDEQPLSYFSLEINVKSSLSHVVLSNVWKSL